MDFKYELLTGAGFEVGRRGVASVCSEGKTVQVRGGGGGGEFLRIRLVPFMLELKTLLTTIFLATRLSFGFQVLWGATVDARYKKVGEGLRVVSESFRVYADGVKGLEGDGKSKEEA